MKDIIENEKLKSLFNPPNPGDVVKGKIIGRKKSNLFLDLGNFGTGVISGKELAQAKNLLKDKKIGEEISAKVIEVDNAQDYVELSVAEAQEELAWIKVKELKEKEEIFPVKILKANKGGLIAEIEKIPAFLPVSHLSSENYPYIKDGDQTKIMAELQKFIGQELQVKILNLDSKQKVLILSEKKALAEKTKEALKNLKIGDVVEGKITGLVDFGAFMKFKAPETDKEIEGLIHLSELDWQVIEDPAKIVKIGQKIKAKIIDLSQDKVSLSLKALQENPWGDIEKKHQKGEIISGEVVKFNPFGAFVKITPQIQGLAHVSEFGTQAKMKQALKIGEKYQFEILLIDAQEYRINLRLIPQKNE